MRTPSSLLMFSVLLLAGCAPTEPTVAPHTPLPPGHTALSPSTSPTPTPTPTDQFVPGPLRPGPEAGTVLSANGVVLRLIPSDPDWSFECRKPTDTERRQLDLTIGRDNYIASKPIRSVSLPEGYSVVAYWGDDGQPSLIISGERFTTLGTGVNWYGSHTHARVAFEDGPKAVEAALECVR